MSDTAGTERNDATEPATGTSQPVDQHTAGERQYRKLRAAAQHALHPVVHIAGLVTLHSAALFVLEKTPVLALLSLH